MHTSPVLYELVLLAGFSLAVLMAFQRLRLPPVVGLIVTGVLIGPGGFGVLHDLEFIRAVAEFGVMLLLLTVGLEFSPQELRRLGRGAFLGGALQVVGTIAVVAGVLVLAGQPAPRALFVGMLASLSSTALVLKQLTDRVELSAPHGRLSVGVLIFQDLMVVPFAIAVPLLGSWLGSGSAGGFGTGLRDLAGLAAPAASGPRWLPMLWAALVFALSWRVVPWLLARALQTRSREAFLFGVVLVTLGAAAIASWAGLSMALGAFLAGLMLADSRLRSQITADVLPFRDAFSSVFFVSIGLLFDPREVLERPLLVLVSTVGLVAVKAGCGALALRLAGMPWRVSLAAGLVLAQVGEFSFMLAAAGAPLGLLSGEAGTALISGAVFSLLLTPWLVRLAPEWAHAVHDRAAQARAGRRHPPGPGESGAQADPEGTAATREAAPADHVVIAGFGLNGQNLARVLRSTRASHLVVDLNPASLDAKVAGSSPVLIGDIANATIQERAGVPLARVLVLALSDPVATRRACGIARALSRRVFIIVRTRYVNEIDELYRLGANQVIPEEFETSIEIFTAALRQYHVPMNVIQAQIQLLRQERYSLLRGLKLPHDVVEQLDSILQQGTCETFVLLQHSPAIGRSLGDIGLSGPTGARVVALVRGGHAIAEPGPEVRLQVGDTLVLAGAHAELDRAFEKLSPRTAPPPLPSPL